ncbi:hypothetical protein PG995_014702 [Apiospora arundinis]
MSSSTLLLSPAELAYLHNSLSLTTPAPIRPDGRSPTQFRPLTAETGILPGTNGSARICFADGTEAIVGVKAEVEKTPVSPYEFVASTEGRKDNKKSRKSKTKDDEISMDVDEDEDGVEAESAALEKLNGSPDWVELSVEIPGLRDDDSGTVFLTSMLTEALLADGEFVKKLWINRRFHWKLYLDVNHTHLPPALLPASAPESHHPSRPPRDPPAAPQVRGRRGPHVRRRLGRRHIPLPPPKRTLQLKTTLHNGGGGARFETPITLLVMAVGDNIIFDPSKEELAVADSAVAVSVAEGPSSNPSESDSDPASSATTTTKRNLHLLSVRTIDPPSRLTPPGVPNSVNATAWGTMTAATAAATATPAGSLKSAESSAPKHPDARVTETEDVVGVWKAPRGGAKFAMLGAMVAKVLERGGVAEEVLDGLEGVELG